MERIMQKLIENEFLRPGLKAKTKAKDKVLMDIHCLFCLKIFC